jgi:hypothetical protein
MPFYIKLGRIKLFREKRIPRDYSISAHRLLPGIQNKWEMLWEVGLFPWEWIGKELGQLRREVFIQK